MLGLFAAAPTAAVVTTPASAAYWYAVPPSRLFLIYVFFLCSRMRTTHGTRIKGFCEGPRAIPGSYVVRPARSALDPTHRRPFWRNALPKADGSRLGKRQRSRKCRSEFYKLKQFNVSITRRMVSLHCKVYHLLSQTRSAPCPCRM